MRGITDALLPGPVDLALEGIQTRTPCRSTCRGRPRPSLMLLRELELAPEDLVRFSEPLSAPGVEAFRASVGL